MLTPASPAPVAVRCPNPIHSPVIPKSVTFYSLVVPSTKQAKTFQEYTGIWSIHIYLHIRPSQILVIYHKTYYNDHISIDQDSCITMKKILFRMRSRENHIEYLHSIRYAFPFMVTEFPFEIKSQKNMTSIFQTK